MDDASGTELRLLLASLNATMALGRAIGEALPGGLAVGLVGPLGAGKTHLMKAIAVGNGFADPAAVTSPTFTMVQEYVARLHLYHIDVYRLGTAAELASLGFDEMLRRDSAVVVEWADRVAPHMPDDTLWVQLTRVGLTDREAILQASGAVSHGCLDDVRRAVR